MRKIYGILAAVGILFALIPVSAMAYPEVELGEGTAINNKADEMHKRAEVQNRYTYRQRLQTFNGDPKADCAPKKYVEVKGVWGFSEDNVTDGYFAGRIVRRHRAGTFRGVYNTTDNESKGKIFGILRHGYFNGRLTTQNGSKSRIVGLYKFDREDQKINLKWMTPRNNGWAIGYLEIPDTDLN